MFFHSQCQKWRKAQSAWTGEFSAPASLSSVLLESVLMSQSYHSKTDILHFEPGTNQIADSGRVILSRNFHTYLGSAVLGIKALDDWLLSSSQLGFAEWSPFALQFYTLTFRLFPFFFFFDWENLLYLPAQTPGNKLIF